MADADWHKSSSQYCVYTHSHNGEVFYVGKGTQKRAMSKATRNSLWQAYVEKIACYDIEIVFASNDYIAVGEEERRQIEKLAPCCNVHMNPSYNGPMRGGRPRKVEDAFMLNASVPRAMVDEIDRWVEVHKGVFRNPGLGRSDAIRYMLSVGIEQWKSERDRKGDM